MGSPEEDARKKSQEAKGKEPEKSQQAAVDGFNFVGQLVGDVRNLAVDAVSGAPSGEKVLSGITPELAARYQRGKSVQERLDSGSLNQSQLNAADRRNLDSFNNVRKTIAQVPLYDRESLMRFVEKGIEQMAKPAPHALESQQAANASEAAIKAGAGDKKNQPSQSAPSEAKTVSAKTSPLPHLQDKNDSHTAETKAAGIARGQSDHMVGNSALTSESKAQSRKTAAPSGGKEVKPAEEKMPQVVAPRVQAQPAEISSHGSHHEMVDDRQAGGKSSFASLSAARAFERRTTYDASLREEEKTNSTKQIGLARLPGATGSVPDAHDAERKASAQVRESIFENSQARVEAGARRSFDNMRLVLVARTLVGDNPPQKNIAGETSKTRSQSQAKVHSEGPAGADPETYAVKAFLKTHAQTGVATLDSACISPKIAPFSERRESLSESKKRLPLQRMQQIVQVSAERFPSGLRWQNTLRRPDEAPLSGQGGAANSQSQSDFASISKSNSNADSNAKSWSPNASVKAAEFGTEKAVSGAGACSEGKFLSFKGRLEDRYITGAEIALAAIIAAAGARRVRFDEPIRPGAEIGSLAPRIQRIETIFPGARTAESGTPGAPIAGGGKSISEGRPADETRLDGLTDRSDARIERGSSPITFTSTFRPGEKRFFTGVEFAIAAVIASCGTARIRQNLIDQPKALSQPGDAGSLQQEPPTDERFDQGFAGQARSGDAIIDGQPAKTAGSGQDELDDGIPGTLTYLQTHKLSRHTTLIGSGDTLVSIAESFLQDGSLGWLLADINLSRIKETWVDGKRVVELRSRQSIEIPCAEDIAAFFRHRKEEFKPENLITIVIETQVDRELLNSRLGFFVDDARRRSKRLAGS